MTNKTQNKKAGFYREQKRQRLLFLPARRGRTLVELHSPDDVRRIGSILKRERVYEKTIQHHLIHENTKSIGVNEELLNSGRFDTIRIKLGDTLLETTTEFFKAHSYPVCYKNFEVQRLLEIRLFGMDKARRWMNEKRAQSDLFGGQDNEK